MNEEVKVSNNQKWLADKVAYLKGLKSRSEQQELLLLLAENSGRSAQDEKKFNAIVKAEKAADKAAEARREASKIIRDEKDAVKKAERKARDHELYNSAGLLIMAGLVDTKTGKPTIDKAELLGALIGLAKVSEDNPKRTEWRKTGQAALGQEPQSENKIDLSVLGR